MKPRVAILVSGEGSTAESFILSTQQNLVSAEVGIVICNNTPEKAGVYERITRLNNRFGLDIEVATINKRTNPDGNVGRGQTLAESEAICKKVSSLGIGHVALMGYMKMVRGDLLDEYGWSENYGSIYLGRMSNTHPGPLPETADTHGLEASKKAIDMKLKRSKTTLHLVSAGIDAGPVISTEDVDIKPNDKPEDLLKRIKEHEKIFLPLALGSFLTKQSLYFNQSN